MRYSVILWSILLFSQFAIGQSRHTKRPERLFVKGDTIKGITVLNKKIDKHQQDAYLYLYRAKFKIERGDLNAAMVDLNSFCVLNKTCGEAGLLKSWILYRQGNYKAAIEQLTDYTRIYDSSDGFLYLGLCHLQLKNYGPAQGAFEHAAEMDPQNHIAVYNAGLAAYRNMQYDVAESHFDKATNLLPSDYDSWFGLGIAQNAKMEFEDSNKALRQSLAVNPNSGEALFNIGLNYFELGNKDQACSYWKKAENAGNLASKLSLERHCEEKATTSH